MKRITIIIAVFLLGLIWLIPCKVTADTNVLAPRVFNVLNYGAVGDDKTDNTAAFSACIKAVIEAGGGRMFLPDGVYRGRIIIPGTKKWITVEIVGESEPTPVWGTIGAFPFQKNGTILKCLDKSGSAVIYADNKPEKLYNIFSGVYVVIRNLDVRTYDNPGISGIDMGKAAQCKIENVFINTDIYSVQASKPTHGTSGLITPANNNGALTILNNVMVTGYYTGILVNEHTNGDNINLGANINSLEFAFANHASRFGRVCSQRSTHHVTVSGKHGFSIEQLNTEMPGRGQTNAGNTWQTLVSDINDPKNLGIGDINYWVVLGGKGAVDKFVKNGGASIRTRRIGSAAAASAEPVPPKISTFKPSKTVNVQQAGAKGDGQADDAAAIQKALDGGDCLVVIPPGVYKISKTLKVASKTWIKADKQAFIRLANGAGKDADSFMLTNADPVKGNQDIIIEGGTWDGNNANNPRGPRHGPRPSYGGVAICFANVRNLTIRDLTVRNPQTFSILLGETEDFLVENIVFDQSLPQPNQDGVHVNGFSQRGLIRNLKVSSPTGTNDDMVALNADDDITAMFCHGMKVGPIKDVRVENLQATNAYTFVRLLSAGNPVENVAVDGISGGFRMNVINIDSWRFPPGTGVLRNITIRNVRVHKQGDNPSPFIRLSSKVDGLRIENFKREPGGNPKTPTMLIANKKNNKIEVETDSQTVLGQGSITELKLDTK